MIQWDDQLWLLTEDEFDQLEDGVILKCIDNSYEPKSDSTYRDTRFGYMAFGLTAELVEEQNLKHKFLLFLLKS